MPHVIIADDNEGFRELLTTYCERAGWTVQGCANGAELFDAVAQGSDPVLLLIDVMMPVMDGIEAIEQIYAVDRPMRLRFMTGGESALVIAAKLIASARDMSVGRNIFKPVRRSDFLVILEEEQALLHDLDGAASVARKEAHGR